MGAVRWRYEFDSRDGVEWKVDIFDPSSSVGSPHEFTKGQGFSLNYESNDAKTHFNTFIFSNATISIVSTGSSDTTQLENIINADSEEMIALIYKDGSIYWRGIILPDLIENENRSLAVVYNIPATDGLKRLQNVKDSSISAFSTNIIRGLVTILNETGIGPAMASGDTIIKTANRWYENNMAATGTGVDPLQVTRFLGTSFFETNINQGVTTYTSFYDILEEFLKSFKLRCFMGPDGVYHLIQSDQYGEGVLYLFSYPRNYTSGSVTPSSFDPDIVNPNIEANGSFSYAPIVGEATAQMNIDNGAKIIHQNQRNDWETERTIATVTRFDANTQINFDFLSGPTITWEYTGSLSTITLRALKADISIKLELDATYYLTNKTGGLSWSKSSSDRYIFRTNNVNVYTVASVTYLTANASLPQLSLLLPNLPTSGDLDFQITATLIDPSNTGVTASVTLSTTTAKITASYADPGAVNGTATYNVENEDTESSYIFNAGTLKVSDLVNANYTNGVSVYDGSTWVFGTNWKRQSTGTAYNLITLGLTQVISWHDTPMQILNASVIDDALTALSRVQIGSTKYVFNRGSLNANLDTWSGSWIEIPSTIGGPTIGLDDPIDEANNVVIGSGKRARPDNRYADLLENSVFAITTTNADHSGTVTSIGVNAANFDISANGDEVLIVDPVSGESDTLTLSGDFLSATTSISVNSISLSRTYPKGSYIYISIGQLLQRVYNLENP